MSELALSIRPETRSDDAEITRLHERTFGPGRFSRSAFLVRERSPALPELCFSALVGTLLVGSIRVSPVRIGTEPALMLGPLAVDPAFDGRGIGRALMVRTLEDARLLGHRAVILVGDEPYYARFGFRPVAPGRIMLPGPVDPARLLALELVAGAVDVLTGHVMPCPEGAAPMA